MNVISASYGNDSCAMIQWAHENGIDDVVVTYIDTGWAGDGWADVVTDRSARSVDDVKAAIDLFSEK